MGGRKRPLVVHAGSRYREWGGRIVLFLGEELSVSFDIWHIARMLGRGLIGLLYVGFIVAPGLIASRVDLDADDPNWTERP